MITLVTLLSRQFNNGSFSLGPSLLSSQVDVADCNGLLLRMEAETVNSGASFTITYQLHNGGVLMGGSTTVVNTPGRYEIAIGRSDMDNTTTITASVQFVGRSRINAVLYSMARGEDIQPWL
jgi:hypothetical protein